MENDFYDYSEVTRHVIDRHARGVLTSEFHSNAFERFHVMNYITRYRENTVYSKCDRIHLSLS